MNIKSNKFFISFVALLLVLATTANSYAYFQSTIGISSNDTQMDFITKTNYYPVEFYNGTTKLNAGTDKYLIEKNTRNELIISGTTQANAVDWMAIYLPVAFMAEASPNWDIGRYEETDTADGLTGVYEKSEHYVLTFKYENIGDDLKPKSYFHECFGFTVSENYMLKRAGDVLAANNNLTVANHGGTSMWIGHKEKHINGDAKTINLSFHWNPYDGVPQLSFNFSNIIDGSAFKFKLSDFSIRKFAQAGTYTGNYVAPLRARIMMWQDLFIGDYTATESANQTSWNAKTYPVFTGSSHNGDKYETEAMHSHIRYVDDTTVSLGLPCSSYGVSSTTLIPLVFQSGVLTHANRYYVSFDLKIEDPYFIGSSSTSRYSDMGAYVSSVFLTVVGQARNIDPSSEITSNAHPKMFAPIDNLNIINGALARSLYYPNSTSVSSVPYPIRSLYGHTFGHGNNGTTRFSMRDSFAYSNYENYNFTHTSSHTLYFWAFNNNDGYGDVNGNMATASTNPWLVWEHGGAGHTWHYLPIVTLSNLKCGKA